MLIRNDPEAGRNVTSEQPGSLDSAGTVLRHLMDQRHLSYETVAREVERATGVQVTSGALWRIVKGKVSNPGSATLGALAEYFDVDLYSFFSPYRITPARRTLIELPSIADRLNNLIDTMHPAGQPAVTDEEIAEAMTARGCATAAYYVHLLRSGNTEAENNLTVAQLRALADILGLTSIGPLVDGTQAAKLDAQLNALVTERDAPASQAPRKSRRR
jgi:transcriptional regulator with XRE-family HTH domain